ncbi:hypothetical protein A3A39_03155 [Candidatus Kaiserbacteria bacterium RIFCSPLOWO2_01_FULL_54_13]|uniref:Uncharacterized protein n=1 Tax=Candidatus Kaiserbacteria bacterium RIFCSPLOWO2_01_FULL_54_13 TaxID=1798512 RepID=A0A1F6F455_9BACT|nr:MAG: hypothetical protein A3A39_03155 [Candidatus Kaiserbacteria bacterium RIFCSPLOWO2_01_FULL_54_13]
MSLEKSYRRRDAHEAAKRRGALPDPVSGESLDPDEHDRPLAEIFGNTREHDLFVNHYLYQLDATKGKEVAEALEGGTVLLPDQEKFLEKARVGYNTQRARLESVQERITPEELKRIAFTDKRIAEVVGKVGPEKFVQLLNAPVEEMAMGDPKQFKKLSDLLRLVHEVRTGRDARLLDRRVSDNLTRYGISEEQYTKATESGLTLTSKDNLAGLVREQYGWFKTAVDFVSSGALSHRGGRKLYTNLQEEHRLLQACDVHLKKVGKMLAGTLNTDMRLAMQKFMLEGGPIVAEKNEYDLRTIGDFRHAKGRLGDEAIKRRFEEAKRAEAKRLRRRVGSLMPADIDRVKNSVAQEFYDQQRKYKGAGILAALFGFLFGTRTRDDIKSVLP